jgi:transcriptional regulator with XRE-family HTH domain
MICVVNTVNKGHGPIDGAQRGRHDQVPVAGESDIRAESIGRRLRRLRLEHGVSQRELSAPGITYAYISRIEAGARQPSVKALRMLARRLGVTPEYLETGSNLPRVQVRELRLAELELRLRLDGEADTTEALAILDEAETAADLAALVRARILLGFAAAAAGDALGAVEQLARVIGSELVTPLSRPDVYATLGHAYASAGLADQAVALFERALEELERAEPGNRAAEVRYATYLSYALTDLGEIERARAVLADLWSRSEHDEDRYTRVRLYWSLGRVALEEGRALAALDDFRRAIALLEATEDAVHLARAHLACAEAALSAGEDLAGARAHSEQAEWLLRGQAARADLAVSTRIQAALALQAGEGERAQSLAEQALELSRGIPAELGRAWAALAQARAATGDPGADEAFAEAASLLREHGGEREHAELLRAQGRYLRDAGREHEALGVFEQAAEAAANLHGERSGARR